jgi:hypothetical protein
VVTEHAAVFDGLDDYVEIADHPDYSIAATGELTVVALIRPDSLEMPAQERTGYVHWLGKGVPGQDEWTFRMYQRGNTEDRENRISCYAFNLDARAGGTRFGIGSHFQDELTPGQWLLVAGAWDATRVHSYRDGVLRDSDLLDQSATGGVMIVPEHGDAPVRIGTRDFNSFFQGRSAGSPSSTASWPTVSRLPCKPPARAAPSTARSATPPAWSGSGGWARRREVGDGCAVPPVGPQAVASSRRARASGLRASTDSSRIICASMS